MTHVSYFMSGDDRRERFRISADPSMLQLDIIHGYLSQSYWAAGIPRATVERSIQNSLCFGVYGDGGQIGFARVISDYATYAYLADVFILESHRGRGLSKWLMECIQRHPQLQNLRRWSLVTRDAHGLYQQFGWVPVAAPERYMEKVFNDVYRPKT